jgi:hypothetical protein
MCWLWWKYVGFGGCAAAEMLGPAAPGGRSQFDINVLRVQVHVSLIK